MKLYENKNILDVPRAIHWDLWGKCGIDRNDNWYNYVPESTLKNENTNSFDTSVYRQTTSSRLDLALVDKSAMRCKVLSVAISEDSGVKEKEDEKVQK